MSWITEHPEEGAEGEIAALYAELRASRGKVANILRVHSLRPAALRRHLELYLELMFAPGGLSRRQREMVAVVVSRANRCEYCVQHHLQALRRYLRDEDQLATIAGDFRSATLDPREMAMLAYAHDLTVHPERCREADLQRLRAHGMVDQDILLLNLICAYFNFVNRIALGLGVTHSADEVDGYLG